MLFHTLQFLVFMAVLVPLAFAVPRMALVGLLLVASYVFYGFSGPWYVLLLAGTSLIDYSIARFFETRPHRRRTGIALSAVMNFSVLAFFKYSGFLAVNLNWLLAGADVGEIPVLKIVLPVGISFYTFQSFAYVVDVLMGRIPACRSLPRFLLFVSWFPQLVAGPIMRAGQLLPQVDTIGVRLEGMHARVAAAAMLFAEGWLRKAFADLAAPAADAFFRDPRAATSAAAVYGIVAFGLQIYGDFSGYSRMAQGASWLFGVRLVENFDLPYRASSVRDFWRRWHISLSSWFRDYVYFPLGGNRRGPARTYFNLALTMLLCGLWHGANWTFLLWGGMHAAAMIVERVAAGAKIALPWGAAQVATAAFVFLAWVPFRSTDIASAAAAYAALGHGGWQLPTANLVAALVGMVAVDAYTARAKPAYDVQDGVPVAQAEWRAGVLVASCALLWALGGAFGRPQAAAFIYFQF